MDNGSFETDTNGWSGYKGATIQRVMDGVDGDFSLEVSGPAFGTDKFGINDSPNWVESTPAAGARYRFSAWVKSTISIGLIQLRVREYNDGIKLGSTTLSAGVILSPIWQQITIDHIAEAAGSTLDFQVLDAPVTPGEIFQTDDISIILVPDFPTNENLVENSSFEINAEGWNGYNGATVERVMDGLDGDFSLEITGPASLTQKSGLNDSPNWVGSTLAVGTRYRFSAWVKSDFSTGTAELKVREFKDRVRVGASTSSGGVDLSPTWQLITVDHTTQAAGSTLDFQLLNADPGTEEDVFQVDDISIVIVP